MDGLDDAGYFFSDNFSTAEEQPFQINLRLIKKKFKEFLRQYHEENFNYKYR